MMDEDDGCQMTGDGGSLWDTDDVLQVSSSAERLGQWVTAGFRTTKSEFGCFELLHRLWPQGSTRSLSSLSFGPPESV